MLTDSVNTNWKPILQNILNDFPTLEKDLESFREKQIKISIKVHK